MGEHQGSEGQDANLVRALHVLLAADEAGEPLDNEQLADALGWDLASTGDCLGAAKARSLIWASRGSRQPGPWFSEIEVTMQGRRFLRGKG
jgi:hypothetical protein